MLEQVKTAWHLRPGTHRQVFIGFRMQVQRQCSLQSVSDSPFGLPFQNRKPVGTRRRLAQGDRYNCVPPLTLASRRLPPSVGPWFRNPSSSQPLSDTVRAPSGCNQLLIPICNAAGRAIENCDDLLSHRQTALPWCKPFAGTVNQPISARGSPASLHLLRRIADVKTELQTELQHDRCIHPP